MRRPTYTLTLIAVLFITEGARAQDPTHIWSDGFGDPSANQRAYAVATDGLGNIVVAGTFEGTVDFGGGPLVSAGWADIFLAKFDASGRHLWSHRFGNDWPQSAWSVAVDRAGDIVLTGIFLGSVDFGGGPLETWGAGACDIFLAKFDQNGNHLWSRRFGDEYWQWAMRVTTDSSCNVILVGTFDGKVNFGGVPLTAAGYPHEWHDIFVAKYDPNGNHLWSQRFGDTGYDYAYGVAADELGNVIVTGRFEGTVDFGGGPLVGTKDVFVAKFDQSGNHLWSQRFGAAGDQIGMRVAVDEQRNVIVGGYFSGALDLGGGPLASHGLFDIFVAKFDESGNHVWSQGFGDSDLQYLWDLAVDRAGYVVIAGAFYGTVNFGGGPLVATDYWLDAYMAKFDSNGNHVWSRRFGDVNNQSAEGVAVDSWNYVVIAGYFFDTVDFGNGPLVSAGEEDIFVAKFGGTAVGIGDSPAQYDLEVWACPNPFNPTTTIAYSVPTPGPVELGIYDPSGRLVKSLANKFETTGDHITAWDGRDDNGVAVASGVYFVRLRTVEQARTRKIVFLK